MGQKPLDEWMIRRINQLRYDQHLSLVLIAKRLDISRTTVRRNLMELAEWQETKKPLT